MSGAVTEQRPDDPGSLGVPGVTGASGAADAPGGTGATDPVVARPGAPAEVSAEAGALDPVPEPVERRYPSTIGGACYLVVLAVVVTGLVLAAAGPWRLGVQVVAGALMAASVLRLALRQRDAGMLAVRHRLVDALLLAGSAAALVFLAQTIPNQPG